ncbi:MAG: ParA family protein [Phycisphaeraceae bacterium]
MSVQQTQQHRPAARAAEPGGPRIMALMNQKGGVGKTTTCASVGGALARAGRSVLLVDLDPQAHLTLSVGVEPDELDRSLYDLLADPETTAAEVVQELNPRLGLLPAEVSLAGIEGELAEGAAAGRSQTILRDKTRDLVQQFDYVLVDCPPSLGLLTVNGLTLAGEVIVPMQAHFLALQGLSKLFETVKMVREGINPELAVAGIVLCMHEANTILAGEVTRDLEAFLAQARGTDAPWADAVVYQPPIRRNIKLAECPSFGQPIFEYAPESNGAADYAALAEAIEAQRVGR